MPGLTESVFAKQFADLPDPRVSRTRDHELLAILLIAILAIICGANHCTEIALFGRSKQKWFEQWLPLPHGIPSHDTFSRVLARLDPAQFQQRFLAWVAAVSELTKGQVIAIDGKTLRHSYDTWSGKSAIQMVSAWATANHLVLGQLKVDDKSNEITAIPELLGLLEVAGCVVTVDAMGCQKSVAQAIIDQGAQYVLAVKRNQGNLYQELQDRFELAQADNFRSVQYDTYKTVDKGHGRIELRRCCTISDPDYLLSLTGSHDWPELSAIAQVRYERRVGDHTSEQIRYYITSLPSRPNHAQRILSTVRAHWRVENSLHWVLDIGFREDDSRVRKDHAAENLGILRRIALNLLKRDHTTKVGIHGKRLKAGWDEAYLLSLLFG
jgi:predicted transposase YbfD/YdcC